MSGGAVHTADSWAIDDLVVWPNGIVGEVWGVDFGDQQLLDSCGGWHDMADCERVESKP